MDFDTEDTEAIAKAAIEYLIAQEKPFEASLLLRSKLSLEMVAWDIGFSISGEGEVTFEEYAAVLLVPPDRLDFYRRGLTEERSSSITAAIQEAIQGSLTGSSTYVKSLNIDVRMSVSDPFPEWRETYDNSLRGDDDPLNQGIVATASALFSWNGLQFRSRTEAVLAAALAKVKVLFFPLPAAVSEMKKREPDFLICADGKWGILEVQGEPFHPPETATKESERRRWFLQRGVKVVEFYDAGRCYNDPDGVVQEFLSILKRNCCRLSGILNGR